MDAYNARLAEDFYTTFLGSRNRKIRRCGKIIKRMAVIKVIFFVSVLCFFIQSASISDLKVEISIITAITTFSIIHFFIRIAQIDRLIRRSELESIEEAYSILTTIHLIEIWFRIVEVGDIFVWLSVGPPGHPVLLVFMLSVFFTHMLLITGLLMYLDLTLSNFHTLLFDEKRHAGNRIETVSRNVA
ncbi:unnamed protein product [Caenorhabditis brenneri]